MEQTEQATAKPESFAIPEGHCLISTMDASGDLRETWDPLNPKDVAKAKATFERLRKMGYAAFRRNLIDPNVKGPRVKDFHRWDGELIFEFAEIGDKPSEVLMVPPLVGG